MRASSVNKNNKDLLEHQFELLLKQKFDDQLHEISKKKSLIELHESYADLITTDKDVTTPVKLIQMSSEY